MRLMKIDEYSFDSQASVVLNLEMKWRLCSLHVVLYS